MGSQYHEYLSKAKEAYLRDGVACVRGVFSATEVNGIRASALYGLGDTDPDSPYGSGHRIQQREVPNGHGETIPFPAIHFWPVLTDPLLNRIRTDERMAILAETFLGKNVKQLNNQVYFRLPGDGDAFAWHQDVMFRKEKGFNPEGYLQTIICVDPLREDNGALRFAIGSHRQPDHNLSSRENLRDENAFGEVYILGLSHFPIRTITADPGDVVVWNLHTIHGSQKNVSTRSRMTFMNGFAAAADCGEWPWYLKDGKVVAEADGSLLPYR